MTPTQAYRAALEAAGDKIDRLAKEMDDGSKSCAETHPEIAEDRAEHADDVRQLAAAIRALPVPDGPKRSFPEAADGSPSLPMEPELWAAGCDLDTARFVARQLASDGYSLTKADELGRLRAENERLRRALSLYSCEDGCNECPPENRDEVGCGWTAYIALKGGE